MKRVLIVHDYHASSEDHWYPWLKLQILATGNECETVQLEQADHPLYEVWKHNLFQQIKTLNEDVIIVAHGLGCVASLAFLSSELFGRKLGAVFLVAGFNQNVSTLPELNLFLNTARIDDALLRLNIVHRLIFFSNNDPFIPAPLSIQLGHLLNTQMVEVKGAGHFMAADGFNTLTVLWEKLVILLNTASRTQIVD